jgi:hypothetical protein
VSDEKETQSENKVESTGSHTLQVGIRMQQGEHTGQPIYSNITSVQGGQGVVFVDFGFLEPQALQSLAQMTQSGEKAPETIGARMSSRMAISIDAAANLARQLNQLLQPKAAKITDTAQRVEDMEDITSH